MNILFSSCGRRVELMRFFNSALEDNGGGSIIAVDADPLAAALRIADIQYIVPMCYEENFIPTMLEICKKEKVDMLIPLIDPELRIYAEHVSSFKDVGTRLIVSDPEVIEVCEDKISTAMLVKKTGLRFLRTLPFIEAAESRLEIAFPAVLKPRRGSGGKDVFIIGNKEEANVLAGKMLDPVIQEFAQGQEITIDCLFDFDGILLRFVARERLEIRAGESSKGRTFKDRVLLGQLVTLCKNFNAFGPITIQCFRDDLGYVFTEINPRFGGGYPLAQAAGADFPAILLSLHYGEDILGEIDNYKEGIYMSRFDQAFYFTGDF